MIEAAARRLGYRLDRIDDGCFLVQRHPAARQLIPIGKPRLGVHLVVEPKRSRRHIDMVQRRMAEYLLREQVAWVLRASGANCVLDVGGNVGQFGTSLRRAGYQGRIVSFEPVGRLFSRLEAVAAPDPDWWVRPYALGSSEGTAEIHRDSLTLSSLLSPSDFGRQWSDRLSHQETETIQVRRLDEVYAEATVGLPSVRAYLKMDTQGFDLEVFRGASDVLGEIVGIQSEVACVPLYEGMPRLAEQLATYEAAGFEAAGMFQVSRDLATLRVIEFDLVMVRPHEVRDPSA
jgi:FkbM family methyltransferase